MDHRFFHFTSSTLIYSPGKKFLRDRARNVDGCARHGARDLACTRDPLRAIARDFSYLWPISTPFRAARIVVRDCARGAALFCVTLRYTKRLYLIIIINICLQIESN